MEKTSTWEREENHTPLIRYSIKKKENGGTTIEGGKENVRNGGEEGVIRKVERKPLETCVKRIIVYQN